MRPSPGRLRRFIDHWRARRDGKRDGLLGIPANDEPTPPPALAQIAHRAHESLADLTRGVVQDQARHREHLDSVVLERRAAESDIEAARREVAEAERREQEAHHRRDSFTAQTPVQRGPRISRTVYGIAIALVLIAEFPLNAIAFRLFGEAEALTWVMTAGLAVMLVLCAHGLGTFLRQSQPTLAERRWIVVLMGLPVLAIVAIAVIRARYLGVAREMTGFDTLGPVAGSAAFLVINLLIYTGATMLSYLAHAPRDRKAERVEAEAQEASRQVRAAQSQLAEVTRRLRSGEEQLSKAEVAKEEALQALRARAEAVTAYHRGLMAAYCKANLRARGNPQVPASLRKLPPIEMPDALRDVEPETGNVSQLPPLSVTGTDR